MPLAFELVALGCNVRAPVPVDADQDRADTLVHPRRVQSLTGVVGADIGFRMRVRVDEARRDDLALRVHDVACVIASLGIGAHVNDLVAEDHHVALRRRRVCARIDRAALDQGVGAWLGTRRADPRK